MRALIQRVSKAQVSVNDIVISKIGMGILVFLGVDVADQEEDAVYLSEKISKLRIFDDSSGVMNLSVMDIQGEILSVSQFTLLAQTKKGNRPSYINAANPEKGNSLYSFFCQHLEHISGIKVYKGEFGANMEVLLNNDGPVTIWIDSKNK